jgi:hypothetical protein
MKVRVTYTVDHEEVPKLIDDLVSDCRVSLQELSNFKFDVRNSERATEDVRSVQDRLDTVATKLEDCLNLCLGYDGVVNPAPPEYAEETIPNE